MRLFPFSSNLDSSPPAQDNKEKSRALLYLNVYDLTPINNYLYWFGLGIFHSGIEVHGLEYGFGAHEYPTSGVFEVEPRSCPDEVCQRLTGKPIPGWVNRLARVGSFCNCLLPESIQATSIRHLPENQTNSEDGSDSGASSVSGESEVEDLDHHHLLVTPNSDVAFLMDKPVRLAKDVL